MKKLFLTLLVFIGLTHAQTFEEYKQVQLHQFNAYKDAIDKEFSNYLKQPWRPYKAKKTAKMLEPKPKNTPVVNVVKKVLPVVKKGVVVKKIEYVKPPKQVYVALPKPKLTPRNIKINQTKVQFFGHVFYVRYTNPLDDNYKGDLNHDTLTKAWEKFATSEYTAFLDQLTKNVHLLGLNDWGTLKLLDKTAKKIFRNQNERRLFTWFIFTKMGKEMKVGYTKRDVVLLAPLNTKAYSTVFYTIKGKNYYAIDYTNGKKAYGTVKTYAKPHPSAKEVFDLRIAQKPKLKQLVASKQVTFEDNHKKYSVKLKYDKVYTVFFKGYPQIEYEEYFDAPLSAIANSSFKNQLSTLIEGKTEVQAVNLLLHLVQKGFNYKVDEGQFGYEKVMLPEETLFYPYSDCEDRSILFARLVRDLLHLEVLGLKYPKHISTAVALKSTLEGGQSFRYKGKRYYMADPTYINSDLGMVAPSFKKQNFKVIHVH